MALGIRQMVALGGSLVFAIPVGIYALEQLLAGESLLGAAAVVVGVLMVALPQYLTTPDDLPGKAADRALDSVVTEPDDDSAGDTE